MTRHFTADQVKEAVFEWDVETEEGENRRWSRSNSTIVKMEDDKYYELVWEEGLTEMQDNEFYSQSSEEYHQIEETITVKKWVKVV